MDDVTRRGRLAVVRCDGRQGSGYLLSPRLVLTAAHLVEGDADVRVMVPGSPGEVVCARAGAWRREQAGVDVALLAAPADLAAGRHFPPTGCRWARIASLGPVPDCDAIGFPYVQRDAAGRLDSEQLTGTYKPGSGLFTGRDVLALDGTAPARRADGVSPLAGLSGAAVFARGVLMGVVTTDPSGWQHGRVTVTPMHRLLDENDFVAALAAHGVPVPRLTAPPGQLTDEGAEFELRYGTYIAQRHGTLRIFGIDVSERGRASWPLDAAYYSLEAAPGHAREDLWPALGRAEHPAGPLPAEQALAGHDRVVLRGVAGSGKTTLVQWLAVTAARQEPGGHLGHLRDLVPYVLPLRTIARRDRLPAPAGFLGAVDVPMSEPAGWTEAVLREGRGLVLVDGLDEIDERARERVGDWLRGLLAAYPGNRWLVTSRPSAVAGSWLADEGFTELVLSPMSRTDVRAFTARWHAAARRTASGDEEELARIDGYERTLLEALHAKQDLARLATNPLMCGLICALHRDRGGYLPTGRKELYDAALSMLLVRRDQERDLAPLLTEAPQVQLLQKLAYWLVRNRQAEMDVADAVALIETALPSMPAVAAVGDAAAVYRYLLGRSGLLREPAAGTVDFVHRTFQDYLAARAAVEERDFDLMSRNAHLDQWADVVRMAVAHARPDERARLLRKIVLRGDRTKSQRARLHLLAMACLEHATELDPAVRGLVQERGAALIPPRSYPEAQALAAVGPLVLELLPGPEGLDDDEARAVANTAALLGGDAAIPLLAAFARHPVGDVQGVLARFPAGADPKRYVGEVLDHLPRTSPITVDSADQLRAAADLTGVTRIKSEGPGAAHLLAALDPGLLTEVSLSTSVDDGDLRLLGELPRLADLRLGRTSALTGLAPLLGLPLVALSLFDLPGRLSFEPLKELTGLRSLAVSSEDGSWQGLRTLPPGLGLTHLYTSYGPAGLEGVEGVDRLHHLGCHSPAGPVSRGDWQRLADLPELSSLAMSGSVVAALRPGFPPLPRVRTVHISPAGRSFRLTTVVELFPGVETLSVHQGPRQSVLDLAPLAELTALREVELGNVPTSEQSAVLEGLRQVAVRREPGPRY